MNSGVTIWAFPGAKLGRFGLERAASEAMSVGFRGLDISLTQVGEVSLKSTPIQLSRLKGRLRAVGIEIQSISTLLLHEFPLVSESPSLSSMSSGIVTKMIEIANVMEVPTVSISLANVEAETSYITLYQRAVKTVGELGFYAKHKGVTLCVENINNRLLLSPLEMLRFLDEINLSSVGACLDTGNAYQSGHPEQWIQLLGSRIKKIHLTDLKFRSNLHAEFVDLGKGDINWSQVITALREANYAGPAIVELFATQNRPYYKMLETNAEAVRRIIMGDVIYG